MKYLSVSPAIPESNDVTYTIISSIGSEFGRLAVAETTEGRSYVLYPSGNPFGPVTARELVQLLEKANKSIGVTI